MIIRKLNILAQRIWHNWNMIRTKVAPVLFAAMMALLPFGATANDGTPSPCHANSTTDTPSKDVQNALDILKRECARQNNCTAEQELAAVEKILTGVAGTVAGDDEGFFAYLKEKISIGLRVLTGSYDVEDPHSIPSGNTSAPPIQPAAHH